MSVSSAGSTTAGGGNRPPSAAESVFLGAAADVATPASIAELGELLRDAREKSACLVPAGLGAHAYLGNPCAREKVLVSLARFAGVRRYEPADFTIGVGAGTTLSALRETLAEHGQELPIDFPAATAGTIGGAVAATCDGPRRGFHGTMRNFVLGVTGMRGDGSVYRAGGMVVKNVAGYDLAKLLIGSLGSLGPIIEVNFKLRPAPPRRVARLASFPDTDAAWRSALELRASRLAPAAIAVLDPEAGAELGDACGVELGHWTVAWLFEGNGATVDDLDGRGEKLVSGQSPTALATLDEGSLPVFIDWLTSFSEPPDPTAGDLMVLRLAVLPSVLPDLETAVRRAAAAHGTRVVLVSDPTSGVALARAHAAPAALGVLAGAVAAELTAGGGRGRLLFAPPEVRQSHRFLLVPDPARELARRIQKIFDPHGVFHAERVYLGETRQRDESVARQ